MIEWQKLGAEWDVGANNMRRRGKEEKGETVLPSLVDEVITLLRVRSLLQDLDQWEFMALLRNRLERGMSLNIDGVVILVSKLRS